MTEIIGTVQNGEIDVKRLPLEGIEVRSRCPKCSTHSRVDLGVHPLEYPRINEPTDVYFSCDGCDHYWEVPVKLSITLELYVG